MADAVADTGRNIVLIGGSGRCGTTVLRRMLARHPDVVDVQEWRFMVDPGGVIDFFAAATAGTWTPLMVDERLRRLRHVLEDVQRKPTLVRLYRGLLSRLDLTALNGHRLDVAYGSVVAQNFSPAFGRLAEALIRDLSAFTYDCDWVGGRFGSSTRAIFTSPDDLARCQERMREFYLSVVDDVLAHAGARHFVEKNTWYPLLYDRMLALVPEARLIHITRDPIDVVASMTRQRWAPREPMQAALYYRSIMRQWRAVQEQIPATSFVEISYEDLCRDPAGTLAGAAAFAGLPVPQGPFEMHARGIGSGRAAFDRETLRRITDLLADEIEAYGYHEENAA